MIFERLTPVLCMINQMLSSCPIRCKNRNIRRQFPAFSAGYMFVIFARLPRVKYFPPLPSLSRFSRATCWFHVSNVPALATEINAFPRLPSDTRFPVASYTFYLRSAPYYFLRVLSGLLRYLQPQRLIKRVKNTTRHLPELTDTR